jgi:hypothetical protein
MNKRISAAIVAAIILGSAPFASAAPAKPGVPRYYPPNHNSVMLLEGRSPAAINNYAEEYNYIEKQNVWK